MNGLQWGIIEIYRNKADLLTDGQLCSIAGDPDYTVKAEELPDLLAKHGLNQSDLDYTVARIYRNYRLVHDLDANGPPWRDDQKFRKCEVWIYDPAPRFKNFRRNRKHAVFYFLIENSKAINGSCISWYPRKE